MTKDQVSEFIGDVLERQIPTVEMLSDCQRQYDVFHIVIEEGDHARRHLDRVVESWKALLGQHVIRLADHKKLAETIVSIIEVVEGRDAKAVTAKWGSAVYDAVKELPPSRTPRLTLADAK